MMRRRNGYMLVETVMAMAILLAGSFTIHAAMRQAALMRAEAQDYTHARFLLEELVGRLELTQGLEPGGNAGQFTGDFERFRWHYMVSRYSVPSPIVIPEEAQMTESRAARFELPQPDLGKIRATVSWERMGQRHSVTVETLTRSDRLAPRPGEGR